MPTHHHGRHEFGQNFLTDHRTITRIVDLTAATSGPIHEIGPGEGALTLPLERLGRPLVAVEIDVRLAARLRDRAATTTRVLIEDFLRHRLPTTPHVVVGNLPFHLTTAMLRRLLHAPGWTDAVLLVQWEVARRRAGVGGSTLMTHQWAPWFTFALHGRVPARAFTPSPGVDGGLMTIHRRPDPLLPLRQRGQFQALVHRVFTGKGRGLPQILARNTSLGTPRKAEAWLGRHGLGSSSLPRELPLEAWVDLFRTTGTSPPGSSGDRPTPGPGAPTRRPRGGR